MAQQHHIYFLISDQHFIPTGGIGSFFRGFLRMANALGWRVSVILDRPPKAFGKDMMDAHPAAKYVWPDEPQKYAGYNPDPSRFAKEVPNRFKTQNFVMSLKQLLSAEPPTHILINTPEAGLAVIEIQLHQQVPTIFYTHHENLVLSPVPKSSKFGPEYMAMLEDIVATKGIKVATQSAYNIERMGHLQFGEPPIVLPMPIPDPELLAPYKGVRKGVLFVGRHEPRKQPDVFAKKVALAELPAKVLTNRAGEEKFKKTFAKHGITDFEIFSQITGVQKAHFIQSARVAFHTANLESYGFSAMETLRAGVPTLLIQEYDWWQAFMHEGVKIAPIRSAHIKLKKMYEAGGSVPQDGEAEEQRTMELWRSYLNSVKQPLVV